MSHELSPALASDPESRQSRLPLHPQAGTKTETVTGTKIDTEIENEIREQSRSHPVPQSRSRSRSPPRQPESHFISTRHGRLHTILIPAKDTSTNKTPPSVSTSKPASTPTPASPPILLLLHGNSSSHQIFHPILTSTHPTLTSIPRLAIDLPGHGHSSNAPDPHAGYTQRGYAEAVLDVLREFGIGEFVVLGWSLGGHVGIEMLGILEVEPEAGVDGEFGTGSMLRCRGIVLVGTPPANGPEEVADGFDPSDTHATAASGSSREPPSATAIIGPDDPHMNLAGTALWPDSAYSTFPAQGAGPPYESWMEDAARQTHAVSRPIMWDSFAGGKGVNQRAVMARTKVRTAVVNGASEPFVNLRLLERMQWGNLWEGRCHRLWVEMEDEEKRGLGHTPLWEGYEVFEEILTRLVGDFLND